MMEAKAPLLTDIIETGDKDKAELHLQAKTTAQILSDDEAELSKKIEQAIDTVLPAIKRKLHQQILSSLIKK